MNGKKQILFYVDGSSDILGFSLKHWTLEILEIGLKTHVLKYKK